MDIIEILGRIGFDTRVFLFNLINFLIVALLLQKFFFKKVVSTIEERQKIIAEGIQNAETAKSDLAMSKQKGEEIVKEAKTEANKIISQAANDAEKVSTKIKGETETELANMKKKAQQVAEQERKQLLEKFKGEAADLVMLATEKLLNDKADKVADKSSTEKIISSIKI